MPLEIKYNTKYWHALSDGPETANNRPECSCIIQVGHQVFLDYQKPQRFLGSGIIWELKWVLLNHGNGTGIWTFIKEKIEFFNCIYLKIGFSRNTHLILGCDFGSAALALFFWLYMVLSPFSIGGQKLGWYNLKLGFSLIWILGWGPPDIILYLGWRCFGTI